MTKSPKRPGGDDDSWGKLASDLFGIEFGIDDELDLPDPDELNESLPATKSEAVETLQVAETTELTEEAAAPPKPKRTVRKKRPLVEDDFGGDLFGEDDEFDEDDEFEDEYEEEFAEIDEVEEVFEEVIPTQSVKSAPPLKAERPPVKAERPPVKAERPPVKAERPPVEAETQPVDRDPKFPMTVAEQGDDYWDALDNWSWDESSKSSRQSRPKDLLKTLEAEVAENSRHAKSRAEAPAERTRGRGPSSQGADVAGKSAPDRSSAKPGQRRERSGRKPATNEPAALVRDDEFGSGLAETAESPRKELPPGHRSRFIPPTPKRRPAAEKAAPRDEDLDELAEEIDDVTYIAESSGEGLDQDSDDEEGGEVRRRRRRRRRRRPGGRSQEDATSGTAEELGIDSDELEEHVVESQQDNFVIAEEGSAPADAPRRDRSRRRGPRRPERAGAGAQEAEARTPSDRPERPASSGGRGPAAGRSRRPAQQEIGERDNEFVEETRPRSRRPVSDESYQERAPRDLEVPPSRRPSAPVVDQHEDNTPESVTPANYDDIPSWEEAIGLLVKSPQPDRGPRPPRRDEGRREDTRRDDRYRR